MYQYKIVSVFVDLVLAMLYSDPHKNAELIQHLKLAPSIDIWGMPRGMPYKFTIDLFAQGRHHGGFCANH
ncbi:MAG: hypothetical protein A6F71_10110 [Cycloclasticus sp. symbiont of Poecilosclerida sp. M]|nr:MAG: hypothetical protein A6F71_10110 [Cycloclasticus sp. symbiont of Poecilosclerida sp. M]